MPVYNNGALAGGGFGAAVHQQANWTPDEVRIAHDPYNQLVACPLKTFLFTCLIANQYGTRGQPSAMVGVQQGSNIYPSNWENVVAGGIAPAAMTLDQQVAFLGNYDEALTIDAQTGVLRILISLPKPANPTLFLEINTGTEVFQFGPDNWAMVYWRRHYNEWIRRSLYSFGTDDTFVPGFDHTRGAANLWTPQAYTDLEKHNWRPPPVLVTYAGAV